MTLSKAVKIVLAFLFLGVSTYIIWNLNKAIHTVMTQALSE